MKKYLILLLLILGACSTSIDKGFVIERSWCWDSGYRFDDVDFIHFIEQSQFSYNHDTLFCNSKPVGVIVYFNKEYDEIKIKNIENGEIGLYYGLKYWK